MLYYILLSILFNIENNCFILCIFFVNNFLTNNDRQGKNLFKVTQKDDLDDMSRSRSLEVAPLFFILSTKTKKKKRKLKVLIILAYTAVSFSVLLYKLIVSQYFFSKNISAFSLFSIRFFMSNFRFIPIKFM